MLWVGFLGILGINGAGKTTALKMLSSDIIRTSGKATLAGYDILTEQMKVRRLLGYCPQYALLDNLTVCKHLELQTKGVPPRLMGPLVHKKLKQMNLFAFGHKLAGSLSGGNKRSQALGGDCHETSTGIDPGKRWSLRRFQHVKACSIMLTTHCMEECKALCTRVGIRSAGA
jgi:ATP-binding cassette subfamily A (ABC1) protein 3